MDSKNEWILKLLDVMKHLRSAEGCPWDKEQTHESLKPYLFEECAEFMDAVDEENIDGIKEELGDILLHIVFHSQIADEKGNFQFDDVARIVTEKMWRRHPHVFGDETAASPEKVVDLWESIKKTEKNGDTATYIEGTPKHLPALLKARKVQKKAAKVGFDWDKQEQILEKIEEEVEELKKALKTENSAQIEEEIGDLLFAVVNLSRFRGRPSAEELLEKSVKKFQKRFNFIEKELSKRKMSLSEASLDEMEELWQKSKK